MAFPLPRIGKRSESIALGISHREVAKSILKKELEKKDRWLIEYPKETVKEALKALENDKRISPRKLRTFLNLYSSARNDYERADAIEYLVRVVQEGERKRGLLARIFRR